MRKILICAVTAGLLAGCATMNETEFRALSNYDICRYSMGSTYAAAADKVARERSLDCRSYYGAIQQQKANQNAAVNNYLRSINPPMEPSTTTNCDTVRIGSSLQTRCW